MLTVNGFQIGDIVCPVHLPQQKMTVVGVQHIPEQVLGGGYYCLYFDACGRPLESVYASQQLFLLTAHDSRDFHLHSNNPVKLMHQEVGQEPVLNIHQIPEQTHAECQWVDCSGNQHRKILPLMALRSL